MFAGTHGTVRDILLFVVPKVADVILIGFILVWYYDTCRSLIFVTILIIILSTCVNELSEVYRTDFRYYRTSVSH